MHVRFGIALALGVLVGACGKEKTAAPTIVTAHARDFSFTAPSEISAGLTEFHLVNDGPSFHHLQLVRLDSGKTVSELLTAFKNPGPPPAWATFITGPNAPNPDGGESNATVSLAAGNYALLRLVDVPDYVPHFAKGMIAALTVKPAATGAAPAASPATDIAITVQDYKFTLEKPVTAGHHTFAVKVENGQPHEIEILRLADGKTADDVLKWMEKMDGPPPASALGGVAATTAGVNAASAPTSHPATIS